MPTSTVKEADLAGPGIGDYAEVERSLPSGYRALLGPKETMRALYEAKRLIGAADYDDWSTETVSTDGRLMQA
jgi:hypothetical protein